MLLIPKAYWSCKIHTGAAHSKSILGILCSHWSCSHQKHTGDALFTLQLLTQKHTGDALIMLALLTLKTYRRCSVHTAATHTKTVLEMLYSHWRCSHKKTYWRYSFHTGPAHTKSILEMLFSPWQCSHKKHAGDALFTLDLLTPKTYWRCSIHTGVTHINLTLALLTPKTYCRCSIHTGATHTKSILELLYSHGRCSHQNHTGDALSHWNYLHQKHTGDAVFKHGLLTPKAYWGYPFYTGAVSKLNLFFMLELLYSHWNCSIHIGSAPFTI